MTDSILTEEELMQKHKKERKELQGIQIRNQISYHLQFCAIFFSFFFYSKFMQF